MPKIPARVSILSAIATAQATALDLQTLTEEAVRLYGSKLSNTNVVDDVIDFMLGRFPC
jgi:glycyl-tRNA synthetase beta subunit